MRIQNIKIDGQRTVINEIFEGRKKIGELKYTIQGRFVLIGFIGLYHEYQRKGYGAKIVEKLLKQYPTKSLVGESLSKSAKFWNQCIRNYSGKKHQNTYSDNCVFSFVIPDKAVKSDVMDDMLKKAYDIS